MSPCAAPAALLSISHPALPQVLHSQAKSHRSCQSRNTTGRAAELSALQTSALAGTRRPRILLTRAPPHHMVLAVERSEVCAWRESLVPTHTVRRCAAALLAQHSCWCLHRTRAQQSCTGRQGSHWGIPAPEHGRYSLCRHSCKPPLQNLSVISPLQPWTAEKHLFKNLPLGRL